MQSMYAPVETNARGVQGKNRLFAGFAIFLQDINLLMHSRRVAGVCLAVVNDNIWRGPASRHMGHTRPSLQHPAAYIEAAVLQTTFRCWSFIMVSSIDLKALNVFIHTSVTEDMIHSLVVKTLQVIPCQETRKTVSSGKPLPSLMTFISRLVRYTNVYSGTLMTTLVYLDRLKQTLPKNAQGLPCTRHRIFLSCLILASKFHNDLLPKNVHWADYTDGLFSTSDVNLMERQLLYLLNWNLRVSNDEMVAHLHKFLEPIRADLARTAKMRTYLAKQQRAAQLQARVDTPPISRSSSTALALSLGHSRQDSVSSVESSPMAEKSNWTNGVDPRIEQAAQTEEKKLSRMLHRFCMA